MKEDFRKLRLDGHSGEYEDKPYDRIDAPIKVPEVTSPCGEAVPRCAVLNTLEDICKRTK